MESGDLDIENNIIEAEVEYDWETGMEYMDMEKVLEKRQKRTMMDSMSIRSPNSASPSTRNIPQYDPTEYEPNNPMLYGAYRRWKLAETGEKSIDGKGKKRKVRPGKNSDSFFNSIKKLGKRDGDSYGKGQGFGSRAEPPPNMKSITPNKPVIPKRNRKRVVTPDSIDSLFSSPEVDDIEGAEEDGGDLEETREENIYKDGRTEENTSTESVDNIVTSSADNDVIQVNYGSKRDAPINMNSLIAEEPPKWLVDADREAKAERRMKRKKKKLYNDWRFWVAIIGGAGLLTSAYQVWSQTGGYIGNGPNPTELII